MSAVWEAAHAAIERARSGQGPTFLHARCVHFEGHFLGFQLLRLVRNPLKEAAGIAVPLTQSLLRPRGAALRDRTAGLKNILETVLLTLRDPRRDSTKDPLQQARRILIPDRVRLKELEARIELEISQVLASALAETPS